MTNRNYMLSRRRMLQGMGAAFGLAATGCAGSEMDFMGDGDSADVGACGRIPKTWDKAREKISSIVILCLENRSFDHYFGAMSLPKEMGGLGNSAVNGLRGGEANPSSLGGTVASHRLEDFTPHDLPHDWDPMHASFNGGAMDGFAGAAEAWAMEKFDKLIKDSPVALTQEELARVMANEAMGFHTPDQLPMIYQLAKQSTLCESWFSSVMGPTWTNRFFLHGATAEGLKDNISLGSVFDLGDALSNWQSILDVVQEKNDLEAKNFFHDLCWVRTANVDAGRELRRQFQPMVHEDDASKPKGFFARAKANTLPPLSIIDPHFGVFRGQDANDDHPDPGGADLHDIRKGQGLIAAVIAGLASNPDQWNRSLLIITYDEAGGFFDHVAPPQTVDKRDEFRQLGFRVPSMVVGPYVRRDCVNSTQFEHVTALRTVESLLGQTKQGDRFVFGNRYKDKNVLARIDASNDLLSCLDADALEGKPHAPPKLDPVPFSLRKWRDLPTQGFHGELREAAMRMPEEIRAQAERPVLEEVMAIAEELGAVEVID